MKGQVPGLQRQEVFAAIAQVGETAIFDRSRRGILTNCMHGKMNRKQQIYSLVIDYFLKSYSVIYICIS